MAVFIWVQTIFWGFLALLLAGIAIEDRDLRSYWRIVTLCAAPAVWGAWLLITR